MILHRDLQIVFFSVCAQRLSDKDYWRLQNAVCVANVWDVAEATEDLNSLSMSQQQKIQTCWLGTMREYS